MNAQQNDLEYTTTGLVTRFIPNTTAGENAWRIMNADNGNDVVFAVHTKNVISQLRKAGYSVSKAKKSTMSIDDILAELGE
jgi:hypothetical protein